jgi:predicted Zn-dependent protease
VINRPDQVRLRRRVAGVCLPAPERRWRRRAVALLTGIALLAGPAGAGAQVDRLPDLGAASGDELSGAAERRLGESIMRELRADGVVWDDAEMTEFLNRFANRLISTGPARSYQFEFFAVRDKSINAFALPGGFIGIHTGLLAAAGNESELATVMGHEIGHVTQRHIARMLANQRQASMMALAGMVLGALAARSSPDAAIGAFSLGDTLAARSMLSFSRDAEREADRVGLDILREAKFDVRAAPRFFERLQQFNRYNEGGTPVYVRTHPVTGERMTDLQLRIQDLPAFDHRDRIEFKLQRARALAVGSDAVDALAAARRSFQQQVETPEGAKDPAPWFGLANVANAGRDWSASERALDRAEQALGSPHVFFTRLRIANSLGAGNLGRATEVSAQAIKANPDNLAIIRLRAQVLNAAGRQRDAVALLREKTADFRGDAELWRLLGEAHQALGERGLAHKAAAEGYLLRGLRLPAIEQLRLARTAGDLDFFNGSIVDAKLREVEAAYREEMKDARR